MKRITVMLAAIALSACGREPVPSRFPHRGVGDESMLVGSADGPAVVAVTQRESLDPAVQKASHTFTLPAGARVRILAVESKGAQVEVLEGTAKGKLGWVQWAGSPLTQGSVVHPLLLLPPMARRILEDLHACWRRLPRVRSRCTILIVAEQHGQGTAE